MFPLGSVLFPYMPLQLRVFEDRYLQMLSRILKDEPAEFGVVLIERGQEVGGGEHRFTVGTVARITEIDAPEGYVSLLALGDRRIETEEWLPDDPYPQARVTILEDLTWDDALEPLRERAEQTVRRVLALASEMSEQFWPANVALSDDPVASSWQLAGIAPLGPIDQIALLRSRTLGALLGSLIDLTLAAEETLRTPWPDEDL